MIVNEKDKISKSEFVHKLIKCRLIKFKFVNPLHANCDEGHQLKYNALPKKTECQVCNKKIKALSDKYTCNEHTCDYDVCLKCAEELEGAINNEKKAFAINIGVYDIDSEFLNSKKRPNPGLTV